MSYFTDTMGNLLHQTAFFNLTWGNYVMILVACVFLYLAIAKGFEPLLLVPIAFGMLLVNIYPDIFAAPEQMSNGVGGLLHYFYILDEWSILPSLIFLGVGAMTDFGPLIANPISFLLGAAAQFGIFGAYFLAILLGFNDKAAAAVSIIGGADGPTSIFLAGKLGQSGLMGPIAVAAYSYMALVPIIQPPIMKLFTTKKERAIKMQNLRPVPDHRHDRGVYHPSDDRAAGRHADARQPVPRERRGAPADRYGVQCPDVHCRHPAGDLCRCVYQRGGVFELDDLKDRVPRSGRIYVRHGSRCAVRKAVMLYHEGQDQSADRFGRRFRGADGGACVPEGRRGGGSDQLPADACDGTECRGRDRYRGRSRRVHGDIWDLSLGG